MNKEKENNNRKTIIIIMGLIIFILVLLLFKNSFLENKKEKERIELDNNIAIKNNDYVEDSFHIKKKGIYTGYCSAGLTHFLDIDMKFPKIKLKTKETEVLNDKILNDNKKIIEFIKQDNVDVFDNKNNSSLYMQSYYNYLVKDNVIFVSLETRYLFSNNNDYHKIYNYFYDIENDKILTFEEGIKLSGLSIENFNGINSLDECKNGLCGIKIEDDKFIPYVVEIKE